MKEDKTDFALLLRICLLYCSGMILSFQSFLLQNMWSFIYLKNALNFLFEAFFVLEV